MRPYISCRASRSNQEIEKDRMQIWSKSAVAVFSLWASLVAAQAFEPGSPPRQQYTAWYAAHDMGSQRAPGTFPLNQTANIDQYRPDPPPDTGPGPTDPNGPSA
jgi:hypothetical protein